MKRNIKHFKSIGHVFGLTLIPLSFLCILSSKFIGFCILALYLSLGCLIKALFLELKEEKDKQK